MGLTGTSPQETYSGKYAWEAMDIELYCASSGGEVKIGGDGSDAGDFGPGREVFDVVCAAGVTFRDGRCREQIY